jgi:hypothetical protein
VDVFRTRLDGAVSQLKAFQLTAPNRNHMNGPYRIRPYEPADGDDVRALYKTVSGHEPTEEWFEWKFTCSPYADTVPMFVAEYGEEIVGVRPYHIVPLCAGDTTVRAGYFQNVMIRREHHGEGLFSRLNRRAVEHLDGRASLLFCLTNANSRPIYTHWGWHDVTTARTYYRVQNVTRPLSVFRDDRPARVAGRVGTALARGYLTTCDRLARRDTDLRFEHEPGVPAAQLASLYRRRVPDALHVKGDERFYHWRYGSPRWRAETHLATRAGEPVAAIVTRTREGSVTNVTHIADVLPMTGVGDDALEALLARTLDRHPESDVIAATDTTVPRRVLLENGFVPDDTPVLSRFRAGYVLFARALDGVGVGFDSDTEWALPLAVRDTS